MSRWAHWIPFDEVMVARFRAASRLDKGADAAVYRLLEPWLENIEQVPLRVSIDKEWEPIHRCLTGDVDPSQMDPSAGGSPLNLCVLGGEHLMMGWVHTAVLIGATEVASVAAALKGVRKEWFRERFFALPGGQFHEVDEDNFEYVWAHFEDLPPFFARVAETGLSVLCSISH